MPEQPQHLRHHTPSSAWASGSPAGSRNSALAAPQCGPTTSGRHRARLRQYEAALVIDQAQVDAARLNVTYTKIVAPLTGKIGLRMVDKGNYVTMGDASSICVIIQVQPISVLFTIPEDSLPLVRKRLKTGETMDSKSAFRAATRAAGLVEIGNDSLPAPPPTSCRVGPRGSALRWSAVRRAPIRRRWRSTRWTGVSNPARTSSSSPPACPASW